MSIAFFAGGFQVFALGTYGVTSLDIIMILYYILFIGKSIINNAEYKIPKSLISLGMAMLVVSILVSSLNMFSGLLTSHIIQYFKSAVHIFQLMLLSIIFISEEQDLRLSDNLIKIWLVLSIFLNIFGVYQIFARAFDLPLAWLNYSNISMTMRGAAEEDVISQLSLQFGNFFRATSVFSEPTALATFNLYILIFTLIPALQRHESFIKSRIVNIVIVLCAVLGLFLSFSLTGILGLFLILGVIFILESTRARLKIAKYLAIFILLLIPADLLILNYTETSVIELFSKRITGTIFKNNKMYERTDGDSFNSRSQSFKEAYTIWTTSPIYGVGLGLTQYQKNITINYSDFSIMAALAEMGIIGAVSFATFFAGLFYIGYKANAYSKNNREINDMERRQFGIIIYVLIVHFEINFITGNNLVSPNLWFVLIFVLIPIYRYMQLNNYKYITFKLFNKSPIEKYLT